MRYKGIRYKVIRHSVYLPFILAHSVAAKRLNLLSIANHEFRMRSPFNHESRITNYKSIETLAQKRTRLPLYEAASCLSVNLPGAQVSRG